MKKEIEQCDYFFLIIAGKYGSEDSRGMGYTEKEYRFALKQKKPALVFLYKDIEELPLKKVEHTDKQREKLISFRNFALKKSMFVSGVPRTSWVNVLLKVFQT